MNTTNQLNTTDQIEIAFYEKAIPALYDLYQEGCWFSARTGLALAQFDFKVQHHIVTALATGLVPLAAVNRIADFIWKIHENKPVTAVDVSRYVELSSRIVYFPEKLNVRVETCDYCKGTGRCGGFIYGEPLRGRSRWELKRYGHRLY